MQPTDHAAPSAPASRAHRGGGGVGPLFWVTALQASLVLLQAVLAGQFLGGNQVALSLHQANAQLIVLLTLAQLGLAVWVWRRRHLAWPAGASALLLVAVVTQAAFGYVRQLAVHVPLGVAIFGATLCLLVGTRRLAASAAAERQRGDRVR